MIGRACHHLFNFLSTRSLVTSRSSLTCTRTSWPNAVAKKTIQGCFQSKTEPSCFASQRMCSWSCLTCFQSPSSVSPSVLCTAAWSLTSIMTNWAHSSRWEFKRCESLPRTRSRVIYKVWLSKTSFRTTSSTCHIKSVFLAHLCKKTRKKMGLMTIKIIQKKIMEVITSWGRTRTEATKMAPPVAVMNQGLQTSILG